MPNPSILLLQQSLSSPEKSSLPVVAPMACWLVGRSASCHLHLGCQGTAQ
jgi:hypothetical protein